MKYEQFKNQWLDNFASPVYNLPGNKSKIKAEQYIWHLFSWKYLPEGSYLSGDEARAAFDKIKGRRKDSAIYIVPFGSKESFTLDPVNTNSHTLEAHVEIYVAGKDFSWTYIKTHENDMCGPYYCDKELLSRYFEKGAFNGL